MTIFPTCCERVPPAPSHDLVLRWQCEGTWARIVIRLQAEADAKGLITWV
ncbi:hypothetical protein M2163_000783 [Streptomyces sp. SAI-135]|jgi:hypothetical protein|nr:hypothetical protein [Streptomyces sp. SAI-090]MDH6554331.1 hypothetical protein [Streptomyces sp. SAI-041]MDH6573594.1 hypothetical protein [Streptomyces sp. SAI-117]MDH6581670.1 hypothetical protein [Streptomyces sp. SAI-133]MDH6613675.1 hypothetical protein [Streptomyces sp. SAI-135]